jgi:hypothetical protein
MAPGLRRDARCGAAQPLFAGSAGALATVWLLGGAPVGAVVVMVVLFLFVPRRASSAQEAQGQSAS